MFGGLHIELAALKSIGTLLRESGWTSALAESGIVSSGTAESFLNVSSITRTRQMHQVTACCLYKLLTASYSDYCNNLETTVDNEELLDLWKHGVKVTKKVHYSISGT